MAAKISPLPTLRLSIETPVSGTETAPRSAPPVAAMTSSIVHNTRSAMIVLAGDRRSDRVVIAERQHLAADRLARLMPFAGDKKNVAFFQGSDRGANCERPIADVDATRARRHHLRPDRRRIFRAWIVIGYIGNVGEPRHDRAHLRTLAFVAVAAGAEDNRELALHIGLERQYRVFQCIG